MRNRANTYVRTGRSYGGILRNSRNESQNAYNDAYYETGTTFDRVGNRLNRTNLYNDQSHTRDPRYNRHGYNQQMYDQQRCNQQRYSDPEIDRRYASNGYTDQEMAEARRTEQVEKIEYNSTTLSGTYHNLDNPQVDVRDFPEGGQNEE